MNDIVDDLLRIYLSTIDSYISRINQTVNDKYTIIDKSMLTVYLFIKIIEDKKEQNSEVTEILINYLLKQNIYGETGSLSFEISDKSKIGLYNEYKAQIEYTYSRLLLCSSLKRMIQIEDKVTRELLLTETWQNLNTKFPNWKQNEILKKNNSVNGIFMKTMNNFSFKFYTKLLRLIWR